MFTGIVQQLGVVKKIERQGDFTKLGINLDLKSEEVNPVRDRSPLGDRRLSSISKGVKVGDSICINGVCLTVTQIKNSLVFFEVIRETLNRSNLSLLKESDKVNVEFSLRPDDKISGHFVTGHIDCIGKIKTKKKDIDVVYYEIFIPEKFNKFIAPKASIAVDGISLTILNCFNGCFSFYAIPHTINNTTLKYSKVGSPVNIEFDILAKYIHKIIQPSKPSSKLSVQYLKEKGYI